MEREGFCTPREICRMYGNTISEAGIRAACRRAKHPLPHVEFGAKRPVIKIRPSVFERWLNEEMGIDEVDTGARRNLEGVR